MIDDFVNWLRNNRWSVNEYVNRLNLEVIKNIYLDMISLIQLI